MQFVYIHVALFAIWMLERLDDTPQDDDRPQGQVPMSLDERPARTSASSPSR
jgi:hypothetical protein